MEYNKKNNKKVTLTEPQEVSRASNNKDAVPVIFSLWDRISGHKFACFTQDDKAT